MTLAVETVPPTFVPPIGSLKRFSVEEYHHLIEGGMLDPDDRIELLEGWIVYKMTHNPLHDMTVDRVQEALRDRVSKGLRVRVQSAITTPDSEPEPDVVVAQGPADRYARRHPGAQDIALLVEVSDTSLEHDRRVKGALYARAGISVYWIVNINESVVEVCSEPVSQGTPAYRRVERFGPNQAVPLVVDGQALPPIPVKEILP